MDYQNTINWMFTQLPMYQNTGRTAYKKDLSNTHKLSKHLNNPEQKFISVHVTGTNGKGSTSHMLASILQEAGYKVGLYTSPHLKDFRERIKINGKPISEKAVIQFIEEHKPFFKNQELSFFEMTVGLAFNYFAKEKVAIAIIEVGLGGRLDSTNIINPILSVITNIGLDHTQILGDTLPKIAAEKAGIIKNNIPVVIGEYQEEVHPVFYKKALETNSSLFLAEKNISSNFTTDLKGTYQTKNVKTAVQSIYIIKERGFKISNLNIENGLRNIVKNTGLLGRWQILHESPLTICDTAHNKEGLTYVLEQLLDETFKRLHIILGVVNDKELKNILPLFPKNAIYYFSKPNIPRGLDANILKEKSFSYDLKGTAYSSVNNALKNAQKQADFDDLIFIGGSTFVVAEVV
jgi:dihydrofolate synthase/folylpolyglutamate synthase|tara:strand:- start:134 stop:1351 length:1218 start_codon:yes stop_codon:yes gene_type:complete